MGTNYYEVVYKQGEVGWSGKTYTYYSALDLHLKQKVYAPTYKNPRQEAMVVAVNCPEPDFACKEITEIMPEEEDDART